MKSMGRAIQASHSESGLEAREKILGGYVWMGSSSTFSKIPAGDVLQEVAGLAPVTEREESHVFFFFFFF